MLSFGRRPPRRGPAYVLLAALTGCAPLHNPQARKEFLASLPKTQITVFPSVFRRGTTAETDLRGAERIAAYFKDAGVATAVVSDQTIPLPTKWSMNQVRVYRASQDAFSAWVRAHPVATPYALVAEYLAGGRGAIVGVHCYVARSGGTPVYGFLLNSHHRVFRRIKPKSSEDATTVVIRYLQEHLKVGAGTASDH
jgi:hypothetical protein